jgi:hypothetical protein
VREQAIRVGLIGACPESCPGPAVVLSKSR